MRLRDKMTTKLIGATALGFIAAAVPMTWSTNNSNSGFQISAALADDHGGGRGGNRGGDRGEDRGGDHGGDRDGNRGGESDESEDQRDRGNNGGQARGLDRAADVAAPQAAPGLARAAEARLQDDEVEVEDAESEIDEDEAEDDADENEDEERATKDGGVMEVSDDGIEIEYADGWTEEVEGVVYELTDPSGETVEERPATEADVERMLSQAAG